MPLPTGFTLEQTEPKTQIDASLAPTPPEGFEIEREYPSLKASPPKTIFDKMKSFFRESPERSIAKAQNIYALSEMTGLSLRETSNNYDLLKRSSEITGISPSDPTGREMTSFLMLPAIATGMVINPVGTAAGVIGFGILDRLIPTEKFIPSDASDEVKTTIELADLIMKGVIVRGIYKKAPKAVELFTKNKITEYKLPKTIKLAPEQISDIYKTAKLTTAEEQSLYGSLNLNRSQIREAIRRGVAIEIPSEKIITIADKPYWAKIKGVFGIEPYSQQFKIIAGRPEVAPSGLLEYEPVPIEIKPPVIKPGVKLIPKELEPYAKAWTEQRLTLSPSGKFWMLDKKRLPKSISDEFGDVSEWHKRVTEWQAIAKPEVTAPIEKPPIDKQSLIANVKSIQATKELSNITVSRLKKYLGIENIKRADIPELQKLVDYMDKLKKSDAFMSEKQIEGLREIITELPEPEITPRRIVISKFGEKDEILDVGLLKIMDPRLVPTVDIKEGHPLITKISNKADELITQAENEVQRRDKQFNEMLTKAEKSRELTLQEKFKRFIAPQNREIFMALSGEKVELTTEERAVVAYLKNFFEKARKDLALEKYRKHYVTHLERPLMEKIADDGIIEAIKSMFELPKKPDIPINIMLELDNIIGSEKFFRFALERKGGIIPTTNIRRIVHAYSQLYETKKALDQILPEGQAVTKLLLQKKSAVWMKKFLQNLKGRGLDMDFRTGPMGWLSKTADGIIDLGYLKLLGLNWSSALKNLVAGEANSIIVQDFLKYLEGKKRFLGNPKRTIELAEKYGALEGMFYEYAQKGIGKLKALQNAVMVGQRVGEWEIRGSLFASELTDKEWETGIIPQDKAHQINNLIAISQGRFSKIESPLFLQTWYGRMFMQMNRWRITNLMLTNRLAKGTIEEIKAGNYKGKNMKGLAKAFLLYGIGMYIGWELAKAGHNKASRITKSMAESINSVLELFTLKPIMDTVTDNPTYSLLKDLSFEIQKLANYIAEPLFEEPRKLEIQKGLEETYIAPVRTIEDLTDLFIE